MEEVKTIELIGEVRSADLDGGKFTLRLEDGSKVQGEFSPDQEEIIINALRGHVRKRLRIKGRAEFDSRGGKVKRVTAVEELNIHEEDRPSSTADTRPIWQVIAEIGASVPEEEWAKVPKDGSINLDHYLYGAPKVKA